MATNPRSSTNKPSEATPPTPEAQAPPETEEQRKEREAAEKASAEAAANQEKDHGKRKGNLAKVENVETYDPYLDPDVPDSQSADVIRDELAGSGESPTLKAFREAKKEEEKNQGTAEGTEEGKKNEE